MSRKKSLCQMHKSRNGTVHIHPGKSRPGVGGEGREGVSRIISLDAVTVEVS